MFYWFCDMRLPKCFDLVPQSNCSSIFLSCNILAVTISGPWDICAESVMQETTKLHWSWVCNVSVFKYCTNYSINCNNLRFHCNGFVSGDFFFNEIPKSFLESSRIAVLRIIRSSNCSAEDRELAQFPPPPVSANILFIFAALGFVLLFQSARTYQN